MQLRDANVVMTSALRAMERNELEDAYALFERAIAERPQNAAFHNNYGVALLKGARYEDAKREFERALQLWSDYPDALANFARVLLILIACSIDDSKRPSSARVRRRREREVYVRVERALEKALRLEPEHVDAIMTLALLRERQKRYLESAKLLEKAAPRYSNSVQIATLVSEQYANARDWSNAARALEPTVDKLADRRGTISKLADYYGLAGRRAKCKELCASLKSSNSANATYDSPRAWKYLGLCPLYFESAREIDDYWQVLSDELDEAIAAERRFNWQTLPCKGFVPSFQLAHHDRSCRAIKEKFARFYAPSFSDERARHAPSRRTSRRFRVGFLVSPGAEGGFLRSMAGVISRLDPKRWETILIHRAASAAALARLQTSERLEMSEIFERAVESIRELQCDAIYYWKVGGDAWDYFLPMLRLAPIQLASWGVHGTTGVDQIDYFLSQKLAESANAQEHYSEKLVLFNEAPIFQPRIREARTITREELGLPTSGALYLCPHRPAKYHPDYDLYLKEILERDPDGRILVILGERGDFISSRIKERITRIVGATLAKRILFISRQPPRRYGQLFSVATVLLDSSVYSGCVTLYDAFSRGIPCVSQVGELLVQRFPLAAYRAMGIESAPLARTQDEYVDVAVTIGREPEYRRALSETILARSEQLFERRQAVEEFDDFLTRRIEETRSS